MKGYRGAKKKPARLAKRIGVKVLNPVNLASSRVVLIGVRVTVEFRAAITQIIAKVSLDAGLMIAIAFPKQWDDNPPPPASIYGRTNGKHFSNN